MGLRKLPELPHVPRCLMGVASLVGAPNYPQRVRLADLVAVASAMAICCGVVGALVVATAAARGSSLYVEVAHAVCWVV